jgi:hypothetical protein
MCQCTLSTTPEDRFKSDHLFRSTDSSDNGHATDWHLVHYGSMATRGIGAIVMEATAVVPEGRVSLQLGDGDMARSGKKLGWKEIVTRRRTVERRCVEGNVSAAIIGQPRTSLAEGRDTRNSRRTQDHRRHRISPSSHAANHP